MEKIIEKIIRSQVKPAYYDSEKLAMMIKVLMIRFIDWLSKEVTIKLIWTDDYGYVRKWYYSEEGWSAKHKTEWSLEDLFKYWYNNILEK
jgi:hypothetical protein